MRIGPKMAQVLAHVAEHPGCSKFQVAIIVGPHRSTYYGYQIVNRAIKAGIILASAGKGGSYALQVAA